MDEHSVSGKPVGAADVPILPPEPVEQQMPSEPVQTAQQPAEQQTPSVPVQAAQQHIEQYPLPEPAQPLQQPAAQHPPPSEAQPTQPQGETTGEPKFLMRAYRILFDRNKFQEEAKSIEAKDLFKTYSFWLLFSAVLTTFLSSFSLAGVLLGYALGAAGFKLSAASQNLIIMPVTIIGSLVVSLVWLRLFTAVLFFISKLLGGKATNDQHANILMLGSIANMSIISVVSVVGKLPVIGGLSSLILLYGSAIPFKIVYGAYKSYNEFSKGRVVLVLFALAALVAVLVYMFVLPYALKLFSGAAGNMPGFDMPRLDMPDMGGLGV